MVLEASLLNRKQGQDPVLGYAFQAVGKMVASVGSLGKIA